MFEAAKRGYNVLVPCGDYSQYDLVVERNGKFERVQVKSVTPKDGKLCVHTKSMTFDKEQSTNNRSKQVKYSAGDFDWLAAYDLENDEVYFIPANLVVNRTSFALRLSDTKNGQIANVRFAKDFQNW